jgi:hypothetical protein
MVTFEYNDDSELELIWWTRLQDGTPAGYSVYNFDTHTWKNQNYRTVDFGTEPQTVEKESYEWFTANATFQFTIEGTTYYAKAGMTWEQWVDSSYNTAGYERMMLDAVNTLARMKSSTAGYGVAYNDEFVSLSDTIIVGRAYTEKYGYHSGGAT